MPTTPITTEYLGLSGVKYRFEFYPSETFEHLPQEQINQAYAFAFYGDKFLVVNNVEKPGLYGPLGGTVELGENPNDTLAREIKEEANMRVLEYKLIGYQRATDLSHAEAPTYQLRYFAIIEPIGPFVSDPAGKVTEHIYCDETDYKKYFDWGPIGDYIVARAMEMKRGK